jgi:hypothetical protein
MGTNGARRDVEFAGCKEIIVKMNGGRQLLDSGELFTLSSNVAAF